ncbi:hypothetical protein XELAEV_18016585mg [Xenopus laevis]|uniref:Uncharacterized protein n=1 Tax=Xenopus laevis TaxID=8355 RepID=A0A974DBJ9_XENLA|nr:hypothetical protein XELAEV_18016585mg [Xenopus laevis]
MGRSDVTTNTQCCLFIPSENITRTQCLTAGAQPTPGYCSVSQCYPNGEWAVTQEGTKGLERGSGSA